MARTLIYRAERFRVAWVDKYGIPDLKFVACYERMVPLSNTCTVKISQYPYFHLS